MGSELCFVDIPCGAGGLSLGFTQAGFRQVLGADIDPLRVRSYRANGLGQALVARIEDMERLPPHDVFLAGIPCQPFSQLRWLILRRRRKLPPKWVVTAGVTQEVERLIGLNRPRAFLTENVRAAPIPNVAGYYITPLLVHGHWLGMAQPRLRRLTFGFREDVVPGPMPPPFFPFSGTDVGKYYSVLSDSRAVPVKLLAHGKPKTVLRDTPIDNSPERKGHDPLRPGCGGRNGYTVFGGHGPLGHSFAGVGRSEEAARALQGFPSDFVFLGTKDQRLSQIADAVPIPMARWAAGQIAGWLSAGKDNERATASDLLRPR